MTYLQENDKKSLKIVETFLVQMISLIDFFVAN